MKHTSITYSNESAPLIGHNNRLNEGMLKCENPLLSRGRFVLCLRIPARAVSAQQIGTLPNQTLRKGGKQGRTLTTET